MPIQVTVLLYHGRADPEWTLTTQQESEFIRTLNKLQFGETIPYELPSPPPYGFRGFVVDVDGDKYNLFREKIEKSDSMISYDNDRILESILISSSPIRIRPHLTLF